MLPLSYHLRSLLVRKTTTLATVLGLGLVVFLLASVLMLSAGIRRTLQRSAHPDHALVLRMGAGNELGSLIDQQQVALILNSAEIARETDGSPAGVGEVVGVIVLPKIRGGLSNVQVRGVPPKVFEFRPEVKLIAGRLPHPGTDEAIVGNALRYRFAGLDLGQSFSLGKNQTSKVVGIFTAERSSFESQVWIDIDRAKAAFGRDQGVSSVRVRLRDPMRFGLFRAEMEKSQQLGLDAFLEPDYYSKQAEGTDLFVKILGSIVSGYFALGAVVGALLTMYTSISGRRREIGTLRAIGYRRRSILYSLLLESALLGLGGGILGAFASLLMLFVPFPTMNFASWSEVVFSFEPSIGEFGIAVLAGVVLGILGGLIPAWQASRLSVISALRE